MPTAGNSSDSTGPGPGILLSNIAPVRSRNIFLDQTGSMCSICSVVLVYFTKPHFTSATKKESNWMQAYIESPFGLVRAGHYWTSPGPTVAGTKLSLANSWQRHKQRTTRVLFFLTDTETKKLYKNKCNYIVSQN